MPACCYLLRSTTNFYANQTQPRTINSNKALREIANLVLIMGNREIIDSMAPGSVKVMDQVLKLIDAYDLYGSVAYPKQHTQNDISDIYLLPAATRGVFVNIALQVGGVVLVVMQQAQSWFFNTEGSLALHAECCMQHGCALHHPARADKLVCLSALAGWWNPWMCTGC
jgi:hypothetical protein